MYLFFYFFFFFFICFIFHFLFRLSSWTTDRNVVRYFFFFIFLRIYLIPFFLAVTQKPFRVAFIYFLFLYFFFISLFLHFFILHFSNSGGLQSLYSEIWNISIFQLLLRLFYLYNFLFLRMSSWIIDSYVIFIFIFFIFFIYYFLFIFMYFFCYVIRDIIDRK
jgi:hypothetical protein